MNLPSKDLVRHPWRFLLQNWSSWQKDWSYPHQCTTIRQRILATCFIAILCLILIVTRLVCIVLEGKNKNFHSREHEFSLPKSNIVDRYGSILATDLETASVYANPKEIINIQEVIDKVSPLLPKIKKNKLKSFLTKEKSFSWIFRHISPKLQQQFHELGIPGLYLQPDRKRKYPHGEILSHTLGYSDIDNSGLSGVEKFFTHLLASSNKSIELSIDMRVQYAVYAILKKALDYFQAVAGNVVLLDVDTDEILASVSLPTFDPNYVGKSKEINRFNRNTMGLYEPGSTMKIANVAIALETKKATINSMFDATHPVKIGRFKVSDFRGKCRPLSLKEAFLYSSNIASIKIAQSFGKNIQYEFLKRLEINKKIPLELFELAAPLIPKQWGEVLSWTVSYGYGIALSPMHMLKIVTTIVNDGILCQPTLLHQKDTRNKLLRKPIFCASTSKQVRELMRLVVTEGTGRKANVPGYRVFGKTGTAYQSMGKKGYGSIKKRTTSFVGGWPYEKPKYMIILMLDDPKATEQSHGYATAGYNAAVVAGQIIEAVAPMLDVLPVNEHKLIEEVCEGLINDSAQLKKNH
jgi:cell division protein FtsI (penicillin-binding protein 3)